MHLGFGRFLLALAIVGLALGGAFGLGVARGRDSGSTAPVAAAAQTGARNGGAAAAAATGTAAGGAAARGNAITGTVESVNGASVVVRTSSGAVTVTTNDQTAVRRLESATLQDVQPGNEVAVVGRQAADGATSAASIQILGPGAAASGNQGGRPSP